MTSEVFKNFRVLMRIPLEGVLGGFERALGLVELHLKRRRLPRSFLPQLVVLQRARGMGEFLTHVQRPNTSPSCHSARRLSSHSSLRIHQSLGIEFPSPYADSKPQMRTQTSSSWDSLS